MFKEYKAVLKNLREVQDQWWEQSTASLSDPVFPSVIDGWRQQNLENVSSLVGQAVRQSLELQREWLSQWAERASDKKLKPKLFSELSTEARDSTQRWLDNQNQLWRQWLQFVEGSGGKGKQPDFQQWENTLQEYVQRQMGLLNDWSEMADFKALSVNEATKLSGQIAKMMERSIETQQRLWGLWFDESGSIAKAGRSGSQAEAAKSKEPRKKAASKTPKTVKKSAPAGDDLKRISGIGPSLEKRLKEHGINTLAQIAKWKQDDIAQVESNVIRFSGRIKREKWVEQAKGLVS